jgi:NADH-quinone oxidoreductase subunit C
MLTQPSIRRLSDPERDPTLSSRQVESAGLESPDAPESHDYVRELEVLQASEPRLAPRAAEAGAADAFQALLRDRFGVTDFPPDAPPLVDVARHRDLAATLKERGYRLLTCVTASHWPAPAPAEGQEKAPDQFEVAYCLRTVGPGTHLAAWRVRVLDGVEVPSLCDLFAAADWQEREQFDLLGVRFAGHPDLRRIMMPEDYPFHPLRKDRPADASWGPWR